jgi:hypothetical protein
MEPMQFSIIHDGLVICPHPQGQFLMGEGFSQRVDFVFHFMPNERVGTYLPLLMAAPELLKACEDLYDLCRANLDFPLNSIVLRAKHILEHAKGMSLQYVHWYNKVTYPPCLITIPDAV